MKQTIMMTKGINKREAVLLEDREVVEWFLESDELPQLVGSVFKGKVEKVLPGMQAAFVDIGLEKNGFLHRDELLSYHLDESSNKENNNISSYISSGMEIAVQVTKEGVGTKGPRLTGVVAIPGRQIVYMPEAGYIAVSRRIESEEKRMHLSEVFSSSLEAKEGVIIRTQAVDSKVEEIKEELIFLRSLWHETHTQHKQGKAPFLMYQSSTLIETMLTSYLSDSLDEWIVDDLEDYRLIKRLAGSAWAKKVRLHPHQGGSFQLERIDHELSKAMKRRIWLKNGAFIVIDETEAMVVIDVNSGKYTGKTKQSDTALTVNKLAAVEVCKQIRLRNFSGIIVIDFIDMKDDAARRQVELVMEKNLKKDRIRTSIRGFTQLGLFEMTRKKTRLSMRQSLTVDCLVCDGSGSMKSDYAHAFELERLILDLHSEAIVVQATPTICQLLTGTDGKQKKRLEAWTGATLYLSEQPTLSIIHPFEIVFSGSLIEAENRYKALIEQD
ncbi:Rne/Rng family ribonuclease [Shouchella patagoniensis]|uniref:Rne/Rng family ribonuclease n=1 Tax=Shouchella patagoniensis TaxID=228576 RepID=UPI0009957075|nr:Rne/Rng family ribonuclease [Shouchella patagoniensis]